VSAIAIIPARGGSKRILKKNIIDFFGKPMIAWTIEAALKSNLFEKILVSTDDEEIAAVARAYGAEVPFLRLEASDDYSPVSEATLSSLQQAEKFWDKEFDTVVQLMANCPIRGCDDIVTALDEFFLHDAEFQISAFEFGWMNPWWASKLDQNNRPTSMFPKALESRSQDMEKLFCPTGAIWIANSAAFKCAKSFYGDGHVFSPMSWTAAIDIDDYDDLKMAKAVFLMDKNGGA
jgi:CMP-N-acetylneuraminic acid synthetase